MISNPPGRAASQRQHHTVTAGAADVDTLSQVIADAFFDLPPSRWLIPDEAARRRIFPRYFRIFVNHALANGVVHTTPDRTAAALWLPVTQNGPIPPVNYSTRLAAATGEWLDRFTAFDAALDLHHPAGIAHYHLAMLAVRPDRQGQRIGSALLHAYYHHHLDHAAGVPAYLEAASPRTRDLYLRHGYTDLGAPIHLPGGPAMYPMLREPGSRQQPSRPTRL
ncbi:MAG TPA: GNAT family N-acetyltransferase [Streptosporangiaceae bacterium]|nr:GNAT family N-acetyltransferase [Streptosporangiaceae bacterium]